MARLLIGREHIVARPRDLRKITLPKKDLDAMKPEHRSALLMLGLFLNEANWLLKLLVRSVDGMSDDPEGQASFSLAMLMATTLAGKVYEGSNQIRKGWLSIALKEVQLSDELKLLRKQLNKRNSGDTLKDIRKKIAFHYPEERLDFNNLAQYVEDSDAALFMVPEGYVGDILSHLSTLAGIEPLLALKDGTTYKDKLQTVWDEVLETTRLYCRVVGELMIALLGQSIPNVRVEDRTIPDAPEAHQLIRFFVHPPSNLDAMRAEVMAREVPLGNGQTTATEGTA